MRILTRILGLLLSASALGTIAKANIQTAVTGAVSAAGGSPAAITVAPTPASSDANASVKSDGAEQAGPAKNAVAATLNLASTDQVASTTTKEQVAKVPDTRETSVIPAVLQKLSTFTVSRSGLSHTNAKADGKANSVKPDAAAEASTSSSFRSYLLSSMKADENLTSVSTNASGMIIEYKESGLFWGIVPVHLRTDIHVATDGSVTIHYPWYHFLVITDRSPVELAATLSSAIKGNTASSAPSLPALFSRIESVLKNAATTYGLMDSSSSVRQEDSY